MRLYARVAVSKTLSELELRWKTEKPVVLYESLKMPQFEFGGVETSMCEQEQSSSIGKIESYFERTGNFVVRYKHLYTN